MKRYPLPLRSVKEARKLRNVGERVAADLEMCVAKYAPELAEASPKRARRKKSKAAVQAIAVVGLEPDTVVKEPKKRRVSVADETPPEPRVSIVIDDCETCSYQHQPRDRIILLVDKRELARKRGAKLRAELERTGVPFEEHALSLGDFAWAVRSTNGSEYITRHVAERKTASDLSSSLKDGRYREQKYRLARAQLSGIVYLVEGSLDPPRPPGQPAWGMLPAATLESAVDSSAFGSSSFVVHQTSNTLQTARYLHVYTQQLQSMLGTVPNARLLFDYDIASFNERNRKDRNPTVADIFVKQLLAIEGVSAKKAMAVVLAYPTFAHLQEAYADCPDEASRRKMLEKVPLPGGNRKLGPKASNAIAKAVRFDK